MVGGRFAHKRGAGCEGILRCNPAGSRVAVSAAPLDLSVGWEKSQFMSETLLEQPDALRFLQSTGVALPFDGDPWGIIASGLRFSRGQVVELLEEAIGSGIVVGVWGEPNPAVDEVREALGEFAVEPAWRLDGGRIVRWKARRGDGSWLASVAAIGRSPGTGFQSLRFHKAGIPLLAGGKDPLRGSADRTYVVGQEQLHLPPLSYEEVVMADRLFAPLSLDPGLDFWGQVKGDGRYDGEQTRLLARRLVYNHVWRRFALRMDAARLGWEGCGLACWQVDELQVEEAGRALAMLQGAGDVVMRAPDEENPFNLSALVLARGAGEGLRAAEQISRQWGIGLGRWTGLEVH